MQLIYYPDPRLTRRAEEIARVDDDIRAKAERMIEIMHEKRGIGLAANQVGWLGRLIVIDPTAEVGRETVIVNPEIVEQTGRITGEEGCLSLPGVYAEVTRAAKVTVRGLDLQGEPIEIEAEGLQSVVLQHEIDHLDGILFIAKISPADRARHRKRLAELDREFGAAADA